MDEVNELIESALGEVEALGLPGPVEFMVVVALVLVAALIAHVLIDRVLYRIVGRTRISFDDQLVAVVHRPIVATIVILGVAQAIPMLSLPADWTLTLQRSLYTVLTAVIALATARILHLVITDYLDRVADVTGLSTEMGPLLQILTNVAIAGIWIGCVLVIWGQSIAPILASAGVAGLAVSLAARDVLANIFAGISIFLEGTYSLGDYLELPDVQGVGRGEVVGIGLRSTRLATRDDIMVTVPNSLMANSAIVNQSAVKRFRTRIAFGVSYGSDLGHVEDVALRIAGAHSLVLENPAPRLRLRHLGESAVLYELLCWCGDPAQRGRLTHQLYTSIHDVFAAEGISIPPQQVDVRLRYEGAPTTGSQDPTATGPDVPRTPGGQDPPAAGPEAPGTPGSEA